MIGWFWRRRMKRRIDELIKTGAIKAEHQAITEMAIRFIVTTSRQRGIPEAIVAAVTVTTAHGCALADDSPEADYDRFAAVCNSGVESLKRGKAKVEAARAKAGSAASPWAGES